ncbi:MAG: prepilin-type N-terminal cleavage/methylation domain-containing protein [Terrimicrobiaceae bacterium]
MQRCPSPTRAFTLIELLVVIAIIGILAGLILNTAGYVQRKGASSRAETEMAALAVALENYKADNGTYPVGSNVNGVNAPADNGFLLTNLAPATGKVYFEFNKAMTNSGRIVDPFGDNYGYQYPGDPNRNGKNFFDLFSRCASTNLNDWKVNW